MVQKRHTAERAMEREKREKAETQKINHIVCYQGSATMIGFSCDMFKYRELICFEFSPDNISFVAILYRINAHLIMICVDRCYVPGSNIRHR